LQALSSFYAKNGDDKKKELRKKKMERRESLASEIFRLTDKNGKEAGGGTR